MTVQPQPSADRPTQVVVREGHRAEGAVVVTVTGPLDIDTVAPLEEALRAAGDATDGPAADADARPVVVNLSEVDFADSTTVNVLLQQHAALGRRLRLAAPSPGLRRLFELTGLEGVLPLYETVPEAVAADGVASAGK
ncbi:anti-anti-sigma factor [Streptomyces sp. CB02923]|uniref:STAS domain-containing protein n=1 Tax=Streptomyces sp. CB02923 TaxID=1718985 RepID=UPI00093E12C1|nr:STAS domain-containing protein [Streptomyces sp. CB02923]OKI02669.1 anti-anti-sigma factor [Streptomyces sp. CB02923]